MSDEVSEQTGGHVLAKMAEGAPATYREHSSVEEAIAEARLEIAAATPLPVHIKVLVVVSDDQQRIEWAAASDGWQADYRPGSPRRCTERAYPVFWLCDQDGVGVYLRPEASLFCRMADAVDGHHGGCGAKVRQP